MDFKLDDFDIYATRGTKVVVTDKTANAGYGSDQEMVAKYLKRNTAYEIDRTVVSGWSTDVYLKHLPDMPFNSVMFMQIVD